MLNENQHKDYNTHVERIANHYELGVAKVVSYVNSEIVATYWQIGQYIVEFEQGGNTKATYGKSLLENLSKDLSLMYGKGFSLSNLKRMWQFYINFPISAELPHQLSWTHFVELLKISDPLERSFYLQQTLIEKQLQINS
jgi:DUF1016 N-terminal domain